MEPYYSYDLDKLKGATSGEFYYVSYSESSSSTCHGKEIDKISYIVYELYIWLVKNRSCYVLKVSIVSSNVPNIILFYLYISQRSDKNKFVGLINRS